MPAVFAPGTAKKIPKGSTLVLQMHYTPNGVTQSDRSSIGLVFAKEAPKYEVNTRALAQRWLAIPAGADDYTATSSWAFPKEALVWNFLPHMHLRGKSFEYRLVRPDGTEDVLLRVPHYNFNWQSNYRLEQPLKVPAGSRLVCTAHFDNSAKNPNNPDPDKVVHWGDQTWEEMMIGFMDYAYVAPPE